MKRILYAAFDVVPSPKGASTHITYFVQGLVAAGYDVTLITAGDGILPERDTYHGATILRAPTLDDLNFLKRALAFGDFVLNHLDQAPPYDLTHFRSVWSGLPLAQARKHFGYKLLYEVNGMPSVEMKYHYPALQTGPTLAKIAERETLTLQQADAFICPAMVTGAYLMSRGVSSERITVIPNGVDIDHFVPGQPPPAEAVPTVLYVGTLTDWQGLDTLLKAMPLVLEQTPAHLRLIGPSRKRQHKLLSKRARKLGLEEHLSLDPPVPHADIPAAIAQAAVTVAPLGYNDRNVTQGCCPLKVLEYMACGRPIVASNLPVVRELVRPDIDALLFNPDDPADLAGRIVALLTQPNLASTLGVNARAYVTENFTWAVAQGRLLRVYEALLGK